MTKAKKEIIKYLPDEIIVNKIFVVRGQKVMLDYDLAALYSVETRVLNQAVKRNIIRFSEEFMFRLAAKEWNSMRSQIVISSPEVYATRKNMRFIPVALSSELNDEESTPGGNRQ